MPSEIKVVIKAPPHTLHHVDQEMSATPPTALFNTDKPIRVEVELLVVPGFIILCVIILITLISRLCYLSVTLPGNN